MNGNKMSSLDYPHSSQTTNVRQSGSHLKNKNEIKVMLASEDGRVPLYQMKQGSYEEQVDKKQYHSSDQRYVN